MIATVGTLEKKVETVMENLTPEELAKLIHSETVSASYAQAAGKDQDARITEIHRIYDKYVLTKDWPDYAKFWKATDTENVRYWGHLYLASVLEGQVREDALIALLILSDSRIWVLDYIAWSKNPDQERKEILKSKRQEIQGLLQRRQEIRQTIKETLDAGFWEQWQMPCPTIDMTPSEQVQSLLERIEKWIMSRDLDTENQGAF